MNKTLALFIASLAAASSSLIAADKFDFSKLDLSKLPPPAEKTGLTYVNDIRPLLEASCLRCHGEQRPKGDLRLDSLEAALKGGKDGKVIVSGDSKKSPLVIAAAQIDDDTAMPPKRGPGRGGPGPGGPGGFGGAPGRPGDARGPGGFAGPGDRPPGGPEGGNPPGPNSRPPGPSDRPGGFGGGGFGPPPKPLTAEQVGLIRAWIDQGAK